MHTMQSHATVTNKKPEKDEEPPMNLYCFFIRTLVAHAAEGKVLTIGTVVYIVDLVSLESGELLT